MSGAWTGLTWTEVEQLADYTAGVLPGPEADRIAELVRTDNRWAAAYADLVAAEPLVQSALHAAAGTPPSMPDDVVQRLDAALADAYSDSGIAARPARRHAVAPGRRRRVRPALARVAAGALVVVALGGVAAVARNVLSQTDSLPSAAEDAGSVPDRSSSSGEAAAPSAPPAVTGEIFSTTPVVASGTDYTRDSLSRLAYQAPPGATKTFGPAAGQGQDLDAAAELSELATPDGLDRCLNAVRLDHPGEVLVVDFARFEGDPALVIVLQDGDASTIVAVGPDCGISGTDELASVEVH